MKERERGRDRDRGSGREIDSVREVEGDRKIMRGWDGMGWDVKFFYLHSSILFYGYTPSMIYFVFGPHCII